MSNIYATAERLGGDGPVTYTPIAADVQAAARGDLCEQDILGVEDLLLAGLARKCGGTRWLFEHDNLPYAALLTPAGHNRWHRDSRWSVELHVDGPVDPPLGLRCSRRLK